MNDPPEKVAAKARRLDAPRSTAFNGPRQRKYTISIAARCAGLLRQPHERLTRFRIWFRCAHKLGDRDHPVARSPESLQPGKLLYELPDAGRHPTINGEQDARDELGIVGSEKECSVCGVPCRSHLALEGNP